MIFFQNPAESAKPTLAAVQQHPLYAAALRRIGTTVHCLTALEGTKPLAHLQVVERNIGPLTLRWLPRGPIWSAGLSDAEKREVISQIHTPFQKRATWILQPDHVDEIAMYKKQGGMRLLTSQSVAEIDLTRPQNDRMAAQHVKWRNRLRHAEKSELTVRSRPLNPTRDALLLALEAEQRKTNRYSALPHSFTAAWFDIAPKKTRFFTAHAGKEIAAFILVLLHGDVATYHIGWAGPEGRRNSAHNLLIWRAANWLNARGVKRFDLGSVDTENAPGIARFKIGTGAHVRPLGPTFLRLPSPSFKRQRQHAVA